MRRVLMILLLGLFFVGLGSAGFTEIDFTGFEIGLDGWSDPGDDVTRNTDRSYCTDTTCSNGGTWTLEIKDNDANSYSEQTFDLSTPCNGEACDYVMLSFWAFYEGNIDNGEELDVKCDGTTIWSCYPENNNDPGDDSSQCLGTGNLDTWKYHTINLSSPEFGACTIDSSVTLRFESEYSQDGEESWIDGIKLEGHVSSDWAGSNFDKCRSIAVGNVGTSALTDFPAYINLSYDSDMQADYSDLRFYDAVCGNYGNLMDYEIENYTGISAHIWARIPTLPAAGTVISVYYKNNTVVSSGENPTGVWDDNYQGVWHFSEGSGTAVDDSTSNDYDGTLTASDNWDTADAMISNSYSFDGGDSMTIDANLDTDSFSELTVEAYVNADATGQYDAIVGRTDDDNWDAGWALSFDPAGTLDFWVSDYASGDTSMSFTDTTNNHFVTGTYDSSQDVKIYNDGTLQGTLGGVSWTHADSAIQVALAAGGGYYFDGLIDEVRISNIARSADWISQSYQIVENQGTYVTLGNEASPPIISNITASHTTIKGGGVITIYANTTSNGVNDTEQETLRLYCGDNLIPVDYNYCTGGTKSDASYPYDLTCTFTAPVTSENNTVFCRIRDVSDIYSLVVNLTYATDSIPPSLTLDSVAGDTSASYYDTVDDGATEINVTSEAGMLGCRWSPVDIAYSSMSDACIVDGTTGSCNVTGISQGFNMRYVACQDSLGNDNKATNNLDVSFTLDYTAPTTSDDSSETIVAPDYTVTISEADNVDSDPTTLYCTDTVGTCVPSITIDHLEAVVFNSANRGVNYLRYNSSDDVGNVQAVANKTININRLPVFTSAVDNDSDATIGGGDTINIISVSSDGDPHDVTMRVCNSTDVSSSGCGDMQYCTATGSDNVTCTFVVENDSASHTWYAFLYDALGEKSVANATGSYTTDVTSPVITLVTPTNGSTITQESVTFTVLVDEALSSAWYSLNGGANVSMTNSSLLVYAHTNSSIQPDGTYNITFWANDSYGNEGTLTGNWIIINTVAPDTTAPTVTVQSPSDGSYNTDGSVLLNITIDEDISWAGYTNNSGTLTDLGNISTTSWNATVTFVEGQHDIVFYANDSSDNQGNASTTVYVDLNNPAVTTFSCTDVNDSVNVICTIAATDVIGLENYKVGYNATGTWVNSSLISLTGKTNSTSFNIGAGNHSPGGFTAQLYVYDLSGRVNGTSIDAIVIGDDTDPVVNNFTYSPNASDDLDPGVTVYVNATITEDYNISTVYLMHKNSSAADWKYTLMSNNSVLVSNGSSTVIYNASFVPQTENWTFKINATDFAGNVNVSESTTIEVADDVSENITNTIAAVESITYAQRAVNNSLGRLVMNNTGDGTIWFNVSLTSATIQDRLSVNYTDVLTGNFSTVSLAATNITIDVNTTGLSARLYDYNITIVSDVGVTVLEKQLNIQVAVGPYLVTSIGTYSSSVTQGDTGVSFVATVTNLGTSDATGVYLNWTLPAGFSLASGSLARSLANLGVSVSGTNTITIDVDAAADAGDVSIVANASSSNADSASDSKTITIGTVVVPPVPVVDTPSGGGGSGGVSVGGGEFTVYDKVIEIVRGVDDGFEIEVKNVNKNSTLRDLTVDLSGFFEQYFSIGFSDIGDVAYGKNDSFWVDISAPIYFGYEEYDLVAVISGSVVRADSVIGSYKETQNIKLIIQAIARNESEKMLDDAENAVSEMSKVGFNVDEVSVKLNDSQGWLKKRRNKQSWDLSSEIVDIRDTAFEANDLLRRMIEAMRDPKKSNLIVGNLIRNFGDYDLDTSFESLLTGNVVFASGSVEEVVALGVAAFERGDYYSAFERAREARSLLILERKGNFFLFVYLYWPFILLGIFLFSLFGILGYRRYKKISITLKIDDMNKEEDNLKSLIVHLQRSYFGGKIAAIEYHRSLDQHQKRLANIRKTRLSLRNKRLKMLKAREVVKDLDSERGEIEQEIKKIQTAYYVNKKIPESDYKLQFDILNERLAEVEGERATLLILKGGSKKGEFSLEDKLAGKEKRKFEVLEKKRKKLAERDARMAIREKKKIQKKNDRNKKRSVKDPVKLHDIKGKKLKTKMGKKK